MGFHQVRKSQPLPVPQQTHDSYLRRSHNPWQSLLKVAVTCIYAQKFWQFSTAGNEKFLYLACVCQMFSAPGKNACDDCAYLAFRRGTVMHDYWIERNGPLGPWICLNYISIATFLIEKKKSWKELAVKKGWLGKTFIKISHCTEFPKKALVYLLYSDEAGSQKKLIRTFLKRKPWWDIQVIKYPNLD
jgi:hypothetical protein